MSIDKKATYYDAGGIEVMKVLRAKLTREQYLGYLLGTVIVYLLRLNWKYDTEAERLRDAEKAKVYCELLERELRKEKITCSGS